MRFKTILSLVFVLSTLWSSSSSAQTPESLYRTGVESFQKGDLKEARAAFIESLQKDEMSPATLFNLGLTEYRLGRPGQALGLWRKALVLEPGYPPARKAVTWAQEKLERNAIPHDVELWESFRKRAVAPFSIDSFLFLTALFFFASGWLIFRYFGARRRARMDESPYPQFPTLAASSGLGLLIALSLSIAKAVDISTVRGTVLVKTVEARSSPDPSGTPLFQLYEGLEVIIRQSVGEWSQVTYPGGSTGWIPRNTVFATSDKVAP